MALAHAMRRLLWRDQADRLILDAQNRALADRVAEGAKAAAEEAVVVEAAPTGDA